MKKFLKWKGIVLGTLVLIIVGAYTAVYFSTESRINKTYDVKVAAIDVPNDDALKIEGAHQVNIKGCTHCHGANLGGKVMIDDPALTRLVAPNLTKGKGGLPENFLTEDWVRFKAWTSCKWKIVSSNASSRAFNTLKCGFESYHCVLPVAATCRKQSSNVRNSSCWKNPDSVG